MTRIGTEAYWDGGLFSNTPLSPAIERWSGPVTATAPWSAS